MNHVQLGVATIVAVGGCAHGLRAELIVSLSFDKTSIAIGETATATLTASFDGPSGSYFSSIGADLIANGGFVAASPSSGIAAWAHPGLGAVNNGTPSGASLLGLFGAQFTLLGPTNTSNPLNVLSFTVTGTAQGILSYSVAAAHGQPQPFGFTGPGFAGATEYTSVLNSGSLVVTPSPGGLGLLGLSGLIAARRRR